MKFIRNSLRFRIVATFIGIVVVSLVLTFIVQNDFGKNTPNDAMSNVAEDVAALILLMDDPHQLQTGLRVFEKYGMNITLVNKQSEVLASLPEEQVRTLFEPGRTKAVIFKNQNGVATVGVPGRSEGDAVLIQNDFSPLFHTLRQTLLSSLLTVLIIGSLFILLMSRFIVKPIKQLTAAAQKMSSGDLTVRLKYRNHDEFGELMESFNQMARELQKIDSIREDFVSNVSHEMQSPLTSIRGFTKAIQDGLIPPEEQKEHLEIIYEETLRLSRLSDNLLRLASLDSEHHPTSFRLFQLDEQLRKIIVLAEPQWSTKNVNMELELLPCTIEADEDLFDQVWQNILGNAIKYTDVGGSIYVDMREGPSGVNVHIRDTGKGIPQEALPHIFDRFYMVDKARSSSLKGNGLGLSIVIKILNLHECTIDVTSAVGEGTEMVITIPRKRLCL
ncbi:HAMP domain-containing protein [Paenibacillus barcinonensis]|uniref:Heme sensor protein HssS n=1 Tax=Paenibacillus barcinonensis TaxID=198119 RepID=A0A2V4WQD4_PAEBA|nr:HAMP domain-containing sensor histidine kinase [Paenibacillus barcinonensis]PYE50233.1 signal transduction histidine kinase [Paenibacillus barcinonensis]QKS54924.1 HAMP domain-containing protein [Paenibacillus barcinonensis]